METVVAHTTNKEQTNALTALEITSDNDYDPEFVNKIQESRQQAKKGKTVKISLDEIWPS